MYFRIAAILLGVNAGIHLLTVAIFFRLGGGALDEYGATLIWCSIGFVMIGAAFINGPSASDGYEGQMTSMHSSARFAPHDEADREAAGSLGVLIVVSAILSGGTGYLITQIAG